MKSRLLLVGSDEQKHQRARLNLLHQALAAMPESHKTEYLEATKVAPRLVETETDPLCFLRYANFNYWDAAERLVSHWKERKYVFGERTFLPLSLTGETALSRETISAMNQGRVLFLPNDSRGRPHMFIHQSILKHLPLKIRLEIVFYCNMVMMKNPQSQKDGIVKLVWMETVSFDRGAKIVLQLFKNSIPNRIHSLHVLCGSSPILEGIVNSVLEHYNKATNQNTYIHLCKTSQAAADMLLPYDIKKECLPRFLGGSWNSPLLQRLSSPQQIPRFADDGKPPARRNLPGEDSIPTHQQSGLLLPTQFDVLLGQGKRHLDHAGNRYLHHLINLHIDRYKSSSSRVEIKRIKREVFNAIQKSGRFLSLDAKSQKWNEVSDSHALEKIGQTFRNSCKKSSKTKGRASTVAAASR